MDNLINILPNGNKLPDHIAIILDGNGTWAKKRGLKRTDGHKEGAKTLSKIAKYASDLNLKYLTVFGFSTENWKRDKEEVDYLMRLLAVMIRVHKNKIVEHNIKLRVIGTYDRLTTEQIKMIEEVKETTKNCTGLNLTVAFNYGSHEEIVTAVKNIIKDGIDQDDITEDVINSYLYTKELPPVDLLIRTSNQIRISNFLLWQIAYSELLFMDVLWPDFTEEDLNKAIIEFNKRDRRYGGIKK